MKNAQRADDPGVLPRQRDCTAVSALKALVTRISGGHHVDMSTAYNSPAEVDTAPAETIEHRLALVMNGGVSLAVWMGGVACEIDNIRRASNGIPPPDGATNEEKAVQDLWARVAQRAGVRVTVDVIAGTSAGGLNGVLLAAAIARGASLADLKRLWLESGQMSAEALFRPQPQGALSLMNGDFFHDQITGALQKMTPTAHRRDISLIVTSTALGPSPARSGTLTRNTSAKQITGAASIFPGTVPGRNTSRLETDISCRTARPSMTSPPTNHWRPLAVHRPLTRSRSPP